MNDAPEKSESRVVVSLPGEWIAQRVLGPTLDTLGDDLRKLYKVGRDRILESAYRKVGNKNNGARANLRVAHDVFRTGVFTDEAICAEYFGGILASSRSVEGKDDSGVYYVDTIRGLSSRQLHLHYVIYHSLNALLAADPSKNTINPGAIDDLNKLLVYFSSQELHRIGLSGLDLFALRVKELVGDFKSDSHEMPDGSMLPFTAVKPTTAGIILYAVAHNAFDQWRDFPKKYFGSFDGIAAPMVYVSSIEKLAELAPSPGRGAARNG